MKFERSRMTKDDVLFGYRLQVFDLAGRTSVSHACRVFGVHRSTYYAWKAQVDQGGLEMLRPKERRRPQMPNQLSAVVEERIVGFAIAHPGLGPKRIAAELGRDKWGALVVSANGVYNTLCRHGLNTRKLRLSLVAGYRAPYEPPREPPPEPHIDVERPGELVGIDCFKVGKLRGTQGEVWQLTAIDLYSSYGWAELVACPTGNPSHLQTSKLARRIAAELSAAGWALERVLTDNGNEFQAGFHELVTNTLGARHTRIRSGRPQTNGHVERLHRTILEECWRPAFARYVYVRLTGLRRDLDHYLHTYNHDRVHHGRLTHGRIPADIVHGARKMEPR
jgi:transposase InsO family protein